MGDGTRMNLIIPSLLLTLMRSIFFFWGVGRVVTAVCQKEEALRCSYRTFPFFFFYFLLLFVRHFLVSWFFYSFFSINRPVSDDWRKLIRLKLIRDGGGLNL